MRVCTFDKDNTLKGTMLSLRILVLFVGVAVVACCPSIASAYVVDQLIQYNL